MADTTVDFVAFDDDDDACLLVLVEEGWTNTIDAHLRALQDRLYGCLDAALGGRVAALFPKSKGMDFVIQVDCYDLPVDPVDAFIKRFAAGVFELTEYSPEQSDFVRSFRFKANHAPLSTS